MVQRAEINTTIPAPAETLPDFGSEAADFQVVAKTKRRRFSTSCKLKTLEEVDRSPRQAGAIIRCWGSMARASVPGASRRSDFAKPEDLVSRSS